MSINWKPPIRALLYAVQFEANLDESVDHAITSVITAGVLGLHRADYRDAIDRALESSEPLANLVPQAHSESAVRRFLQELRDRLDSEA